MLSIVLFVFLFLGILSAIYAVSTKVLVRAVFSMFATFFCVAAILVFCAAEFLAISHLMIYIGGIIVVMVFAIMLSNREFLSDSVNTSEQKNTALSYTKIFTAIACLGLFVFMSMDILQHPLSKINNDVHIRDIKSIGISLFSKYTLAFELVSLVLLIALMGVSIINRKGAESHAN